MISNGCKIGGAGDSHKAQAFDGIRMIIRGLEIGSTENAIFKLNAWPPDYVFFLNK